MTIETLTLRGASVEVLLPGDAAGGQLTVLRYTAPPHVPGPPLHRHAVTVEAFHGLEGELTVRLDEAEVTLGAGDTIAVPAGAAHGFGNDSDQQAVFLVIAAPAGLDHFLRELAGMERGSSPPDARTLGALKVRYDQLPPANHRGD